MSKVQYIFKRYEKKYIISDEQYHRLIKYAENYVIPDEYGESTICNIYYDTDTYELIRRSIDKPVYKEKFRLRSYGVPSDNDEVFAEIKKKYDGIVYKRRVRGDLDSTKRFLERDERLDDSEQIQNEIQWFLNNYKAVPKMFVAYERTAYYGKYDKEFRITFDRNIRYRTNRLELDQGDDGTVIQERGTVLMEVKVLHSVPEWLVRFLSEEKIYPVSFSKYGNCYKEELLQGRIDYV